jgi:hypothetical protein
VLGRTFVPQTAEVTVNLECLDEDAEKMQLESCRNGGMLRTAFIPASAQSLTVACCEHNSEF